MKSGDLTVFHFPHLSHPVPLSFPSFSLPLFIRLSPLPVPLPPPQEKGREERQSEVANRIKEALNCGLKVLDDAFEKVEVPNTPGQLTVT